MDRGHEAEQSGSGNQVRKQGISRTGKMKYMLWIVAPKPYVARRKPTA